MESNSEKNTVNIPGFEGIEAQKVADILDSIHEIGMELAYLRSPGLKELDRDKAKLLLTGITMAEERAMSDLREIMMIIRRSRTPNEGRNGNYRPFLKYISTLETKS